jgi:hypothetical protein
MMLSKFEYSSYFDISYTSPFLVTIDSPIVCFHPNLVSSFVFHSLHFATFET